MNILVTGASSGIGQAIALQLADEGHTVWGTSRRADRVPSHPRIQAIESDLSVPGSGTALARTTLEKAGAIDVVVNNAGYATFGSIECADGLDERLIFQVLVHSPLELTRALLPSMRAVRKGWIVNITSLSVLYPIPFMASYSAAKSAFSSFTSGLRTELQGQGIHVIEVQPGDIETPFNDAARRLEVGAAYEVPAQKAWDHIEKHLRGSPGPEMVARTVSRVLGSPHPPELARVGDFFQAGLSPLGHRLMPAWLREKTNRGYYGLS